VSIKVTPPARGKLSHLPRKQGKEARHQRRQVQRKLGMDGSKNMGIAMCHEATQGWEFGLKICMRDARSYQRTKRRSWIIVNLCGMPRKIFGMNGWMNFSITNTYMETATCHKSTVISQSWGDG